MNCCKELEIFKETLKEKSKEAFNGNVEGTTMTVQLKGNRFSLTVYDDNDDKQEKCETYFQYCPFCGIKHVM